MKNLDGYTGMATVGLEGSRGSAGYDQTACRWQRRDEAQ
jgi:hypothetical protein